MDELFTDNPVYMEQIQEEVPSPPENTGVQSEDPVSDVQGAVDDEAAPPDNPSSETAGENPEGTETPAQEAADYTELLAELQKQSSLLEEARAETAEISKNINNLVNMQPVLCVSLGIVTGILLIQILASYLRH